MARIDSEQSTVLERVADRLRSALDLNERQCYETLDPYRPIIPKGGEYFVTVAPGDGAFDVDHQVGGGSLQLTEYSTVIVTVYSRVKLDSTDHDEKLLRDARRGLLVLKKQILKGLIGHDLTTEADDTMLRQTLYAKSAGPPSIGQHAETGAGLAMLSINFGVDFDWDLT